VLEAVESQHVGLVDVLRHDPQTNQLLTTLDEKMLYHTYEKEPSRHTSRVVTAASLLSRTEGLNEQDLVWTTTAALLHDIGYPLGGESHEERGAEMAGPILTRVGVDNKSIQIIQDAIRSTKGKMIDGAYITNPQTIIQKILCDADMSLVGDPFDVYLSVSDLLRQELGVQDQKAWLEGQVKYLTGVRWHTQSAYESWEEKRISHLAEVKRILSSDK
jgi:predicted metal-dependent HD superfamily phosphohydrolase